MSETRFTPGPWHASPTHLGNAFDIGATNNDNVALVHGPREGGSENFKANANLIAALPELYEALELADLLFGGSNMNRAVVERKVRAALAKARGEP